MNTTPTDDPAEFYGFVDNGNYGAVRNSRYFLIVKCTRRQSEEIKLHLNRFHGDLFDGGPLGCIGTSRFFTVERVPQIFQSYEELKETLERKKNEIRERQVTTSAWRSLP